jgi:hypothetical protein
MRTTLSIDDDILAIAKQLAKRDSKTVGEVVSALARQGLAQAIPAAREERNGVLLLPTHCGATTVTSDLVNQLRDERP